MNDHGKGILGNRDATSEDISRAMGYAIHQALREHREAGNPVATWDPVTKQVVIVPPDLIVLPDDENGQPPPEGDVEDHGDALSTPAPSQFALSNRSEGS